MKQLSSENRQPSLDTLHAICLLMMEKSNNIRYLPGNGYRTMESVVISTVIAESWWTIGIYADIIYLSYVMNAYGNQYAPDVDAQFSLSSPTLIDDVVRHIEKSDLDADAKHKRFKRSYGP